MTLKSLVNNKESWDVLKEELETRISSAHVRLERARDDDEFKRTQGEVRALRSLLEMKERLNG